MKINFFILFVCSCFLCLSQVKEHLFHDDHKRSWLTYVPSNYSPNKSYPLVIALHGGGGSAKQLMRHTKARFNSLADQEQFIVVYPQGIKKSWNDNNERDKNGYARKENIDDVGFIKLMISTLKLKYNIKNDAIFACGVSNGGLMSQTLALELPEIFKVIGLVASNFGVDELNKIDRPSPFSVLFIHGTNDPIFPYHEGEISVFNKSRGKVLGIEKSISYMADLNGNGLDPISSPIENTSTSDQCQSEYFSYPNESDPDLKIELIKIYNGGHTWPGSKDIRAFRGIVGKTTQDFNACDALWVFFKSTLN